MGFALRSATAADADALTRCIAAAYAGYATEGIRLPAVAEGVADEIRDHTVILAVDADTVLGGAILSVDGKVARLMNVAVDPARAGQGIGKALIDAAISAASEAGHGQITLVTHKEMPGNVKLYEQLGWHVTERDGDKMFMARTLNAGTGP